MGLLLYSLAFSVLVFCTVAFIFRNFWLPHVPGREYFYRSVPTTFRDDVEAGLHSSDFDLASNITEDDARSGLDSRAKKEILKIMKSRRVDFNEGRRIYNERRFAKNNIDPDGMPRDPKFVSFS